LVPADPWDSLHHPVGADSRVVYGVPAMGADRLAGVLRGFGTRAEDGQGDVGQIPMIEAGRYDMRVRRWAKERRRAFRSRSGSI
jgi:hypothetical protein